MPALLFVEDDATIAMGWNTRSHTEDRQLVIRITFLSFATLLLATAA